MNTLRREIWLSAGALCLLIALALAIYWPGLQGEFLFDDFANLPALGRYGPVKDWDSLLRYLASGIADPTGRPVSLLSFLLDAQNWPADPYPFKRSNLFFHAANGVLLYSVLTALGHKLCTSTTRIRHAALLATALWLLHPLWPSTVLYVIQRQAILAAFFTFAGIRTWIASQDAFMRGETQRGVCLAILAVPFFGLLAGLSKMNGFLLPLLLWTLHATVLKGHDDTPAPRLARLARMALVDVPAAGVIVALGWLGLSAKGASGRPWSVGERLMSQPRAIWDYLERLFVPGLDATGIFADGFALSTGWLEPASTLPALAGLVALAAAAWFVRRRWPTLSAATLFFLAGHAMESSVVPLELYFEHRNYLPAALIFWPIAVALTRSGRYLRLRTTFALGLVAVLSVTTLTQARLWGDANALAKVWAQALPDSPRAQAYAAGRDLAAGRPYAAIERLAPLASRNPAEPQYSLALLDARCVTGQVSTSDLRDAKIALFASGIQRDVANQWLARLLGPERNAPCAGLPDTALSELHVAATTGSASLKSVEALSRLRRMDALLALRTNDCQASLENFNKRLDIQRRPEFAHEQVALLARYCGAAYGLAHMDHYLASASQGDSAAASPMLRLRDRIIAHQRFWDTEWPRLRKVLEADLSRQTGAE